MRNENKFLAPLPRKKKFPLEVLDPSIKQQMKRPKTLPSPFRDVTNMSAKQRRSTSKKRQSANARRNKAKELQAQIIHSERLQKKKARAKTPKPNALATPRGTKRGRSKSIRKCQTVTSKRTKLIAVTPKSALKNPNYFPRFHAAELTPLPSSRRKGARPASSPVFRPKAFIISADATTPSVQRARSAVPRSSTKKNGMNGKNKKEQELTCDNFPLFDQDNELNQINEIDGELDQAVDPCLTDNDDNVAYVQQTGSGLSSTYVSKSSETCRESISISSEETCSEIVPVDIHVKNTSVTNIALIINSKLGYSDPSLTDKSYLDRLDHKNIMDLDRTDLIKLFFFYCQSGSSFWMRSDLTKVAQHCIRRVYDFQANHIKQMHPQWKDVKIARLVQKESYYLLPGENKKNDPQVDVENMRRFLLSKMDVNKDGKISKHEMMMKWNSFAEELFRMQPSGAETKACCVIA